MEPMTEIKNTDINIQDKFKEFLKKR